MDVTRCCVAGFYALSADRAATDKFRAQPGPLPVPPAGLLRHADEQTVLALAAVSQVLHAHPDLGPMDDWGVVVSGFLPGRFGTAAVLDKFRDQGGRMVTPQTVPNLSLHSAASTISLLLHAQGPHFGTGGGAFHVIEGLMSGLGVQAERSTPGTWLVLTDWHGTLEDGSGQALALALVPAEFPAAILELRFEPTPGHETRSELPRLAELIGFVSDPSRPAWRQNVPDCGQLVFTWSHAP